MFVMTLCVGAQAAELDIDADAGIAINAVTGEIYYAKEPTLEHAMASTTKIMTALLSVENLDMNSRTLPAIASDQVGEGNTKIDLVIGEQLKVIDALHGLMLPSGNDAANLLGRTVAGSYEAFAEMMNEKAKEIGCEQTCFTTVSGTDAPGHYTTAADYAKIANYAMQYETFRKVVSTSHYTIEAEPEYNVVRRELANTNYLLPDLDLDGKVYTYEGVVGVKTGTTSNAGACLVTAAKKDGTDLITVVLGAPGNTKATNRFTESIKMLDKGFETAAAQPYTVTVEGDTLTAYNPATGYTMTATVTAPDVAFTGDSVEPAIVTTTYPAGINWCTNWDITYTNNDKIGTATASITFGGKTASCEFDIVPSTVTLTEDSTVGTLVIPEGQTYDLGGKTLTVTGGLVVNEGGKLTNGVLNAAKGAAVSLGSNGGWVPVWTSGDASSDAYELYQADIKAGKNIVSSAEGTTYSFGYKLTENLSANNPYGGAVEAGDKIKFGVALELDGAQAGYNFSADSVARMAGIDASAASDEFFKVNLKLAGINNALTKVRVAPIIKVSDLGFVYGGEATGEGSGKYVARINTQGYYTLEDAIAAAAEMDGVVDVKIVDDIKYERPTTVKLNGKTRFITLSRSNIEISGPVTFDGQGVSADSLLFRVYGASTLTLKDGVVIDGYTNSTSVSDTTNSYGIIRVEGSSFFNMDGATISNCSAGSRGPLYITGSTVADIRNSTFKSNTAKKNIGGAIAIYSGTSVNVENCLFEGNSNTKGSYGGAIGIYKDCEVTLKNNTYKNNTCSANYRGGAIGVSTDFASTVTVDGGTFIGNSVDDIGKGTGELILKGEIDGLSKITLTAGESITLDESFKIADAASVAIKGSSQTVTVSGSEMNGKKFLTESGAVNEAVNYVAKVGGDQYTSLAAAIKATENVTSATTIELFADDTITAATTVKLNPNVQIKVTADAVVDGPLTIDGENKDHAGALPFLVDGCSLTLKNGVKIQNVVSSFEQNYCGILRVQSSGALVLDGVTFSGCTGRVGIIGGQSNCSFNFKNSVFKNNSSSSGSASVLFLYGSPATIEGCTFTGNTCAKNGGAIHSGSGNSTLTLKNCTFTGNSAAGNGGAISGAYGKTFTLDGCTFSNNKANGVSEDIYYAAGSLIIKGATSIETIKVSSGKTIVLNDAATFAKTITITGTAAVVGKTVLTGSKVADYAQYFTVSDTLTVGTDGVVKAK